jgi:hypothetical protein
MSCEEDIPAGSKKKSWSQVVREGGSVLPFGWRFLKDASGPLQRIAT